MRANNENRYNGEKKKGEEWENIKIAPEKLIKIGQKSHWSVKSSSEQKNSKIFEKELSRWKNFKPLSFANTRFVIDDFELKNNFETKIDRFIAFLSNCFQFQFL